MEQHLVMFGACGGGLPFNNGCCSARIRSPRKSLDVSRDRHCGAHVGHNAKKTMALHFNIDGLGG